MNYFKSLQVELLLAFSLLLVLLGNVQGQEEKKTINRKFELLKKIHNAGAKGLDKKNLERELEIWEEREKSTRTTYSSRILIQGEKCGVGNADMDLRTPPGVMSQVEIRNQRDAGICTAAAASALYDSLMKAKPHGESKTPPMAADRHASSLYTYVTMKHDFSKGTDFCRSMNTLINEGGCDQSAIEEQYLISDLAQTSLKRQELKGADRLRYRSEPNQLYFIEIDAMIKKVFNNWKKFKEENLDKTSSAFSSTSSSELDSLFEATFPGHTSSQCGLPKDVLSLITKAKTILHTASDVMDILTFRKELFQCPPDRQLPPLKNFFPLECVSLERDYIMSEVDLTVKNWKMEGKKSPETVFFDSINWLLNEKKVPVEIDICAGFLQSDKTVNINERRTNVGKKAQLLDRDANICLDQSNHAVLVTGRRFNPETNECELKITNSWGKDCSKYHPDFRSNCKDGEIYIEANTLLRNATGISYLNEL